MGDLVITQFLHGRSSCFAPFDLKRMVKILY